MEKKVQKKPKIDPKGFFHTARNFIVAADRASVQKKLEDGNIEWPIIPAVVCFAFSIELCFKGIILLDGGKVSKIHLLFNLFHKLSSDSQNALILEVSMNKAEFLKELKAISNAFVDWRYIFEAEYQNANIHFLKKLSEASKGRMESMLKKIDDESDTVNK